MRTIEIETDRRDLLTARPDVSESLGRRTEQ
jgi:hypothetical protein